MSDTNLLPLFTDNDCLRHIEQIYTSYHQGKLSIAEYLKALDIASIPECTELPNSYNEFKERVNYLVSNKHKNGFQNAEFDIMNSELERFYKFVENLKLQKPIIEIAILARYILEYLQDTPISHLPELLFTALTGSTNRAFATAVTRRYDLPL